MTEPLTEASVALLRRMYPEVTADGTSYAPGFVFNAWEQLRRELFAIEAAARLGPGCSRDALRATPTQVIEALRQRDDNATDSGFLDRDTVDAILTALAAPRATATRLREAIDYVAEAAHRRYWDSNFQDGHTGQDWRECNAWPCLDIFAVATFLHATREEMS